MDFFDYASIALQFVNADTIWIPLLVGALCFLNVFAFQACGLFVIAGREGYKHRWMAFVPFVNTYYIGVCGRKNRTFRTVDTKWLALAAAILEFLLVIGYIVSYVAQFKLLNAGCVYEVEELGAYGLPVTSYVLRNVPAELAWAAWCYEILGYILMAFDLVFIALQVFVLSAFFQTYAARRYFLFTLTSVLFPVQGILIFIIRNNKGMNYREFMRREQERQYRMYQQFQQQNFNQNPYNQNPYSRNDGYGQNGYNNQNPYNGGYGSRSAGGAQDDPFSEFGEGNNKPDGGDPFES
ncbi:MAG: hypothetical protein K2L42_03375 [Clostridia bacterium]|nr:hypothetical protein [Clostridia bacterium]